MSDYCEYVKYLFLEIGECAICFNDQVELKTVPCANNHVLCEDCYEKVDICPFCRQHFRSDQNRYNPVSFRINSPGVFRFNSPIVFRLNPPIVLRTNRPIINRNSTPIPEPSHSNSQYFCISRESRDLNTMELIRQLDEIDNFMQSNELQNQSTTQDVNRGDLWQYTPLKDIKRYQ